MASYVATIESPRAPEDAFDYLADFSTTAEWDPGVVRAEKIDDGDVRTGTRFDVLAKFMGRETALTYEAIEVERPRRIVLRAENAAVVSLDTISFDPHGDGVRVTYDAKLTLKGPRRLLDPLLARAFKGTGDRATAGLREALAASPVGGAA